MNEIVTDVPPRVQICRDCGHWTGGRCLKGYITKQNGLTPACPEAIERSTCSRAC
jgi:hypothetical protein